jgi:hypothetical protein
VMSRTPRPGAAQGVDAVGDDLERVDVQAGIGLVHEGELRGSSIASCRISRALLLAAGEAVVDGRGR